MLTFETVTTYCTKYKLHLVGFHNTRAFEGEMFINEEDAKEYCSDKLVYIKTITFNSKADAMAFIEQQNKCTVNQYKRAGYDLNSLMSETPCKHIRELLKAMY